MRVSISLRLILSLVLTALLVVLLVLIMLIGQQQTGKANARLEAQQQIVDTLRQSQTLVLRIKDPGADTASIAGWANTLDTLVQTQAANNSYQEYRDTYDQFKLATTALLSALQGGDSNSINVVRQNQLDPRAGSLLLQQDSLLNNNMRQLNALRAQRDSDVNNATAMILIAGGAVLLLIIVRGWSTLTWVGRPLRGLAGQVRKASGVSSSQWPDFQVERGAPREVEDLTSGFNQLATQLRQHNIDIEQANLRLAELNEEVLAASKAKSAFLTTMSHELRTPLNAIIGFSEMLESEMLGPLTERQHTQLERILRNSQNLLTLINDVLDISRVEAGKLTLRHSAFKPEMLLNSVVAEVEPAARRKGLALALDVTRPLPQITSDEARVRQIVMNLVNNAIKFTKQGVITIGARREPSLPTWLVFTVEDTGIGIPESDLEHIWDEFYQVSNGLTRETGGVGLGLTIVHRLVDALGGDIEVSSVVGQGTRFAVYIPLQPSLVTEGFAGASLYAATGAYTQRDE